jgi:hypothetical protein
LDFRPAARRAFAALYVIAMVSAIAAGIREPDHVFGFQMFNETSKLEIALERRVRRGRLVKVEPVPGGVWRARDRAGVLREFRWSDRVRDRVLGRLEIRRPAHYGLEGQLFRLRKALADVLAHIPDDTETEALTAVVKASHNGRAPERIRLTAVRK